MKKLRYLVYLLEIIICCLVLWAITDGNVIECGLAVLIWGGYSFLLYTVDIRDGKFLINAIAGAAWLAIAAAIAVIVISVESDSHYIILICCGALGSYSGCLFSKFFGEHKWKGIPFCNIAVPVHEKKSDFYEKESVINCGILALLTGSGILVGILPETVFLKALLEKILVWVSVFFIVYIVCLNILFILKWQKIKWYQILALAECLALTISLLVNESTVLFQNYVFCLATQITLLGELAACVRYKLRRIMVQKI